MEETSETRMDKGCYCFLVSHILILPSPPPTPERFQRFRPSPSQQSREAWEGI